VVIGIYYRRDYRHYEVGQAIWRLTVRPSNFPTRRFHRSILNSDKEIAALRSQ